ncbi:MAG TPA: hypothetical protein VJT50_11220 [Pyrinomonadaceae bacterium]|nr:hypothetical protein [Pyrinomonadaceae bacterium]
MVDWRARTKTDLIIEVWEALDCESVGAVELERIQEALRERFGEGGIESPAAIARVVADEGAVLRHPEVFKFDREWRRRQMNGVLTADEVDVASLEAAEKTLAKFTEIKQRFEGAGDEESVRRIRSLALALKQDATLVSRSRAVDEKTKREAAEIVQWLTVWLQEPEMFDDWLDLRRRSPHFLQLMKMN